MGWSTGGELAPNGIERCVVGGRRVFVLLLDNLRGIQQSSITCPRVSPKLINDVGTTETYSFQKRGDCTADVFVYLS